MTLPEAYELLDLPTGTDLQQVRQRFSEQYSEYRMQIDNAPTPNLRQRYEQNLTLLKEAFNLITGGASLDDSHDLPSSAPYEQENNLASKEKGNTSRVKADKANMQLLEALALLGMNETSLPAQVKTAYHKHKTGLETEMQKIKMEGAKQLYQKELEKLEEGWFVIEPWVQNRINQEKESTSKEVVKPFHLETKKKKTFGKMAIIGVGAVLLFIGAWFYISNENAPAVVTASAPGFDALVKTADAYFKKERYLEANEFYQKALVLHPNDSTLQFRLDRSQEEIGLQHKPNIPKPKGYVNDFGNIFTDSQEKILDSLVTTYEKQTTIEIAIVTLDSLHTTAIEFDDFTLKIANKWSVGKKDKDNGILIAISKSLRKIRILNGYGIEKILTNEDTKSITDNFFIPQFKRDDYFRGTREGILALKDKLKIQLIR